MSRWLTYIMERFPPLPHLLLSGGIALSGALLHDGALRPAALALSMFGLLLFLFELRLMDEYKDLDKDRVAHPQRPLPRGLFEVGQFKRAILIGLLLMILFGVGLFWLANATAAVLYVATTAYLLLMYREFFLPAWLNQRPFLYALSHQLIIFPFCAFAVCLHHPEALWQLTTLGFCLSVLGAFLTYEIGRKLDPAAPEILRTYLGVYGPTWTAAAMVQSSVVAGAGAMLLGLQLISWPLLACVLISLVLLFTHPQRYKIVEGVVTLSLMVHVWAVGLAHLLSS